MKSLVKVVLVSTFLLGISCGICNSAPGSSSLGKWIIDSDVILIGQPISGLFDKNSRNQIDQVKIREILGENQEVKFVKTKVFLENGIVIDNVRGEDKIFYLIQPNNHLMNSMMLDFDYCIFGKLSPQSQQDIEWWNQNKDTGLAMNTNNVLKPTSGSSSIFPAITKQEFSETLKTDFKRHYFTDFEEAQSFVESSYKEFEEQFEGVSTSDVLKCVTTILTALSYSDQEKIRGALNSLIESSDSPLVVETSKYLLEHAEILPVFTQITQK